MKKIYTLLRSSVLIALAFNLSVTSFAQSFSSSATTSETLPDSPGTLLAAQSAAQPTAATQPYRFRGIISTRGLVPEGSIQPRQTVGDKFLIATEDNFNLYGVGATAVVAAYDLGLARTPEFGTGGKGYARYYWHTYADRVVEIYSTEFIAPIIFHQDTRFYYLGKGPLTNRIGHSIRRTFVTRSNSGKQEFNYSEIFGAGAAAGISTLYYPSRERSATNTLANWGINLGVDTLAFIAQELYPSVIRAVFHRNSDPATP